MIVDARQIEDGAELGADLCVIGAGAAGITLALEFLGEGRSVILLESGGMKPDSATQSLYKGELAHGVRQSPLHTYRERRFGGSTTIWGGRCVPFDSVDFERRPWMPESGWPLGYGDLASYYPRANLLCEAGAFAYTAAEAFPEGMRPMIEGFASRRVTTDTLERFSLPTDFGAAYGRRLAESRDVRVLLRANCTGIQSGADGAAIEYVTVATLTGRRFTVAASAFVLAVGGLETPRLLLASRDVHMDGLGNATDLVGRFYMSHISGAVGSFRPRGGASHVHHGYERDADGVYCRRRLRLADEAARELGVGNFIARLHHPAIADPVHRSGVLSALCLSRRMFSYEYGKRLRAAEEAGWAVWLGHLRNIAADPFGVAEFAFDMARRHVFARRKFPSLVVQAATGTFSVDFHAEQQPNPESRVRLCDGRDCLGMRQLHVDWRQTALDVHTVTASLSAIAEELERSGCGELVVQPGAIEDALERDGPVGGHDIGTARMGTSRRNGVVDPDCRVHDLRNLFIAGSAVFPTSGQANPTLTIVALALRLADRLKRRFEPQEVGSSRVLLTSR